MRPHPCPLPALPFSFARTLALTLALSLSALVAATPPTAKEEMALLNEVAALVDARRLVHLHESGAKPATASELAAARLIIAEAEEKEDQRVRALLGTPTGELVLEFKNADMPTVARAWKDIVGRDVTVADSLKGKTVTLSVRALTAKSLRTQLTSALVQLGIHLNRQPDGTFIFESAPVSNLGVTSPAPAQEAKRLDEVAREVAARRILRDHAAGSKNASATEVAAARVLVTQAEEKRVRAATCIPIGDFVLELKAADMPTVARTWKGIIGFDVAIADSLKAKRVTFSIRDSALESFRAKLTAALEQNGIYQVWRKDGSAALDSSPEKFPGR